jgi:hypothetical protein
MANDLLEVPTEVNEALALVRENRMRLESAMNNQDGTRFNSKHADAAGKLAQAVKALSTEARLWAQELTERAGRATPEQRTAAAVAHLGALPQGVRADAYRQLVEREQRNVQPLQLELKL